MKPTLATIISLLTATSQALPSSPDAHSSATDLNERSITPLAADYSIRVYPDTNCKGIAATYSNIPKDDFQPVQKSVRVDFLAPGHHISLYPKAFQAPDGQPSLKIESGDFSCHSSSVGWLSWGVFADDFSLGRCAIRRVVVNGGWIMMGRSPVPCYQCPLSLPSEPN